MSDGELIRERLSSVLTALERIPRRFSRIQTPAHFLASDTGIDSMDGICMILIAAGEEFKAIDRKTNGTLFKEYTDVQWRGVIGGT